MSPRSEGGGGGLAVLIGRAKPSLSSGSSVEPGEDEGTEKESPAVESAEMEAAFDELVDALGLPRPKDKQAAIDALSGFVQLCAEE